MRFDEIFFTTNRLEMQKVYFFRQTNAMINMKYVEKSAPEMQSGFNAMKMGGKSRQIALGWAVEAQGPQ